MTFTKVILALACLMSGTLGAQEAQVTPLMSKDLADFPGKEGLMITVVYPPGSSDPIHRHNAHAFVYVLEGSVVMRSAFFSYAMVVLGDRHTSHPLGGLADPVSSK